MRGRPSGKEKALAKASATKYNKGEITTEPRLSAPPVYREPISFHLFISFMDKSASQIAGEYSECCSDTDGRLAELPDKLSTFSWFDAEEMSARFPF